MICRSPVLPPSYFSGQDEQPDGQSTAAAPVLGLPMGFGCLQSTLLFPGISFQAAMLPPGDYALLPKPAGEIKLNSELIGPD